MVARQSRRRCWRVCFVGEDLRNLLLSATALLVLAGPALAAPAQQAPSAVEERQVLPPTFRPTAYDLSLDPDVKALAFKGRVDITGEAPAAGRVIVLNAKKLTLHHAALDGQPTASITYDPALSRVTLTFARPFTAGRHVLSIAYHGKIPKDATVGFFAMDYNSAAGPRRTLATNLEPAEARSVLPCWDEPALKASFTVSVDAPAGEMAISNMPQVSATPLPDGRQRVRFATSPKMSTYLLFVGIGDYERIHQAVDGVDVGVVVKRGDVEKGRYALQQATALLHYYDDYFGVRFPLPKLDLIAAPGEITGGSMENWGAIFYSQEHLLLDPARATSADRQLVFLVVSHEMAHQWFGDLVTMAWWDNLWLNEGFARWMQTHAADALHPEWKTGLQAADIFEAGKRADAQAATHPVLQPVASAEQAGEAFDSITYDKGASVITMLESYVGPDAFRDGVRRYMKAHAYGNTVDADLWSQVEATAGKPVVEIEHDFTRQPGVPLVRAAPDAAGAIRLAEDRFAEDPETLKDAPRTHWRLPLKVSAPGAPAGALLLTDTASAPGPAPLVNAGGLAYARVAYTPAHAAALSARMASLSSFDQVNLMNDAWALGQSGYAPASNLMAFIAALPADADPLVWGRAVGLLTDIDRAYAPGPEQAAFRAWALRVITPPAARLGTAETAGEDANAPTLRAELWRAQAQFGDAEAIARARRVFERAEGSAAEQRAALAIVGMTADTATFDALLARARATTDPLQRMRLLTAMARTPDPALVARMVDIALGPDAPAGTAPRLLFTLGVGEPDVVWASLQPHLDKGDLPIDPQSRWYVIPGIAGLSARSERIAQLRAWGEKDMPADARRPVEAAVGAIRLNQKVQAQALPDISRWVAER
jgi:aminopeptidase N